MDFNKSETKKNLHKTFAGESRASAKYNIYSQIAKREGQEYIAGIFDETSKNELAHATIVYKDILKKSGTTLENLKDAIEGETDEYINIYKEFEKTARAEGFVDIANFYKELREIEEGHKKRYESIYNNLITGNMFKRDTSKTWHCRNCGYLHEGLSAPKKCPACGYPQGYFEVYCKNFK